MRLNENQNKKNVLEEDAKGIPYIYQNRVYLGKKRKGSGIASQVLANLIQRVGDQLEFNKEKIFITLQV